MTQLVTASELRDRFKVTGQTLYNWRKSGKVTFQKINDRNFLYDIDSLGVQVMVMTSESTVWTEEYEKQLDEYIAKVLDETGAMARLSVLTRMRDHLNELIELELSNTGEDNNVLV